MTTQTTPIQQNAGDPVVASIARTLRENNSHPQYMIKQIVSLLGEERTHAFVQQALDIEAKGGMMTLAKPERRRTLGGVFFFLVRKASPPEIVKEIWPVRTHSARRQLKKHGAQALTPRSPAPAQPQSKPRVPTQPQTQKEGTSVKITLIGRPASEVADRQTYVAMVFISKMVSALPKGLPDPEKVADAKTNYVVMIATKQWQKVAHALSDPEDAFIIEGYPQINTKNNSVAVLATNVTTKKLQQAKRQSPGAS